MFPNLGCAHPKGCVRLFRGVRVTPSFLKKYTPRKISDIFVKIPTDLPWNIDLGNQILGGSCVDRKYTVVISLRKMSFSAG